MRYMVQGIRRKVMQRGTSIAFWSPTTPARLPMRGGKSMSGPLAISTTTEVALAVLTPGHYPALL